MRKSFLLGSALVLAAGAASAATLETCRRAAR